HFVANSTSEPNDYWFMIEAWKQLVELPQFQGVEIINIWSDGGGKHFKTTPTITFFARLQQTVGKTFYYNFFASHHGHSVCDAVASHAKRRLNLFMRNTSIPITTPEEIIKY